MLVMKRTLSRNNFVLRVQPINDGNPNHAKETRVFDTKQALMADLSIALKRMLAFDKKDEYDFVIHVV